MSLEAWTGSGAYTAPTFAAAVTLPAIVSMEQRLRRLPDGQEVTQHASLLFLQPVTANGASGRREPIDPRDRITLPSGYTGPILYVGGPIDPSTDAPFCVEVVMG